jgi:hypothetical protein
MLQIPRVPTVKPTFSFGNVALHQAKQDLGKEIIECLRWMQTRTVVPAYQEMLGRFIAAVPCTTGIRDPARLPYPASGPVDLRGTSKLGCMYARLSWIVQIYWTMCIDGIDQSGYIHEHLAWVRTVWERGVDKCKLIGSPREGWTLDPEGK